MSVEKFRPIGRRVLADVLKEEKKVLKSSLDIIITDNFDINDTADHSKLTDRMNAIKVSKQIEKDGELKEGDTCIFNQYSGVPLKFGDKVYLLLREDDIYGVIEP